MSEERGAPPDVLADVLRAVRERSDLSPQDADVLAAMLDEVRGVLERVEWQEIGRLYDGCRFCGQERPDGHTPDCRLSALLSRLKREEASNGR